MFYSGLLCGSSGDQESEHAGHLHVLKKGRLKITRPDARQIVIDTPSILFFHVLASIGAAGAASALASKTPHRSLCSHSLHGPEEEGAELVCATIEFGAGMLNPLIASLPEPLVLPLDALPELAPTLSMRRYVPCVLRCLFSPGWRHDTVRLPNKLAAKGCPNDVA
jgi:Cupin